MTSSVSTRLQGAPHASERGYVFNTLHALGWSTDQRDAAIAGEIADRWVAFERIGRPDTGSAPWHRMTKVRTDVFSITRPDKPRDTGMSASLSRYFRLP